jgi:hypothetical protein
MMGCAAFAKMTKLRSGVQGFMSERFILLRKFFITIFKISASGSQKTTYKDIKEMFFDGNCAKCPEDSEASEEVMAWLRPEWERK